jgi:hypothetical protein
MTFLLKDPDARLDYLVDWGAEYLGEDQIESSVWEVAPDEVDGVAVAGSSFDDKTATVQAEGGVAGRRYRLINHVVMASGRRDSRSIVLRVEKR